MSTPKRAILGIVIVAFLCLPGIILVSMTLVKSGRFHLVTPRNSLPPVQQETKDIRHSQPCRCGHRIERPIGKGYLPVNYMEQTALLLDMNLNELINMVKAGNRISDITISKGKTSTELKQYLSNKVRTHLEEQVKIGRLDSSQADEIQAYRDKEIDNFISSWPLHQTRRYGWK